MKPPHQSKVNVKQGLPYSLNKNGSAKARDLALSSLQTPPVEHRTVSVPILKINKKNLVLYGPKSP